jgi:hypothetical protein
MSETSKPFISQSTLICLSNVFGEGLMFKKALLGFRVTVKNLSSLSGNECSSIVTCVFI